MLFSPPPCTPPYQGGEKSPSLLISSFLVIANKVKQYRSIETVRNTPSLHFLARFVARVTKDASCTFFSTEDRTGIADAMSSSPTEEKPDRA